MRARALAFALALAACGAPPKTPPSLPPLHLAPTTDLAPAAELVWLVDVKPRAIFAHVDTAAALAQLLPDADARRFAADNAHVDPRELEEVVLAKYPETTLTLARGTFDPTAVEKAFTATLDVEGRGVDRTGDALGTIVRTWGTTPGGERTQAAMLGREVVVVERGKFGPLRTAELFAEEKLKRASPALRAEPLVQAGDRFATAPFVAYAPGPFDETWKHAAGGLLAAATAIALAVVPVSSDRGHDGDRLVVTLALYGAWGNDADAAATRLAATWHLLQESAIGKLCGVDHPADGPHLRMAATEIGLELTIDANAFFRGLHAATGADVSEFLGRGRE